MKLESLEKEDLMHKIGKYLIKNSPGMRVVKTALAIFLCLIVENFRGSGMPYHACIATIVCMQPTLRSTLHSAFDRTLGTIIAGVYSYLFVNLLISTWGMDSHSMGYFLLIGALAFPLMYLMIVIKKPTSLSITVIVFLVIMLSTSGSNEANTLQYVSERVIGTLIGIAVALFVNWLPFLNKIGKKMGTVNIDIAPQSQQELSNR